MKRLFWVGVGVGVTVVVLRKAQQVNEQWGSVARKVTPAGIGESVSDLAGGLKETVQALRESMAQNEAALTAALLPSDADVQRARATRARRAEHTLDDDSVWDDDLYT